MEEKVIPPDEKEWQEVADFYKEQFFRKLFVCRIRAYSNAQKPGEGLATMEVFDAGVILKTHAFGPKDKAEADVYLKLSDGCWVKGSPGEDCDTQWLPEIRDGERFLRLTMTLKTKDGPRRRIVRAKFSA